ncbi:TetR/AcrR family transcriptional regulator [Nocardioides sp. LHD-245]|uniref:TetR/AcrR family transcriptional regulator n=1 Tax=Nocardioides sp. LHD-245 TaxID=3051387 RepID=UPI0027E0A10B|nr:TetR/AcrR family transcriptional regulator [Nocardioides sp. LHD-245]
MVSSSPARGRILLGATEVFHASGFHAASMSAIGAAAGVTGPALYRHFSGKHELLAAVVEAGADLVEAAFDELEARKGPETLEVKEAAAALSQLAADHRFHGAIIQRDTRSLNGDELARVRARWHALVQRLARSVARRHEGYRSHDAEMVARAAFAVAASLSYSRTTRRVTARQRELLHGIISTVLTTEWVMPAAPDLPPPARPIESLRDRASRREAIMSVATHLFGRHGFNNVSMEKVAEVAGVTVPTVYSHFTDKATLMSTAQEYANAWLWLAVARAVQLHSEPGARLREILDSYARFGVDHPDHMSVLVHEVQYLPDQYQPTALQTQQDYVAEIVRPLQSNRPELDDPTRRLLVHAALGVVNELTRTTRYFGRPHLQEELARITVDICHV